jgi:hypothetical protein
MNNEPVSTIEKLPVVTRQEIPDTVSGHRSSSESRKRAMLDGRQINPAGLIARARRSHETDCP